MVADRSAATREGCQKVAGGRSDSGDLRISRVEINSTPAACQNRFGDVAYGPRRTWSSLMDSTHVWHALRGA